MDQQLFFFVLLITTSLNSSALHEDLILETLLGYVKGTQRVSYEGKPFISFEGIPYAKPPLGGLRFKEPQPRESWQGLLMANRTYVCMQYVTGAPIKRVIGEEDCLYLNVYVPPKIIKYEELLPVVIFIHEGGFVTGSPRTRAGPQYLMDRDVVLVTMNYRLGILGFLSTYDAASPGNYGLKDQVLAMKWVKDNIVYFGGNSKSITLVGASAGGASVQYHYVSPLSIGLFNRGFSQSGVMLNVWALAKTPVENTERLAVSFGCKSEISEVMVDCLKKISAKELVYAMGDFYTFANAFPETPFGPTIEPPLPGAFLSDHPYKLLLEGQIQDLPWVTSTTKEDGIVNVGPIALANMLTEIDEMWDDLVSIVLSYNDTVKESDKYLVAKLIREYYLHGERFSLDNIHDFIKLATDREFLVDAIKSVWLQSARTVSPVYYYLFEYRSQIPLGYKLNLSLAGHGDDTRLMFPYDDNPVELTESDRRMKDILLNFLYVYAKTGIPTLKEAPWFPIRSTTQPFTYIRISSPKEISMDVRLDLEFTAFWNSLPLHENDQLFDFHNSKLSKY